MGAVHATCSYSAYGRLQSRLRVVAMLALDGAAVADTGTSADSSTGSPHTDMGNVLDVDFVAIVGMPRSGTSVLAQMQKKN